MSKNASSTEGGTSALYDALRRYIARLLHNSALAEDFVQEVFMRRETHGQEIEPEKLRSWMYRVARNLVIDHLRRDKRRSDLAEPDLLPSEATRYDPSLVAQQKETQDMLLEMLNELPARQREVVRLKFQEGLTYAEIADITGQTRSTVGWLLHQAMTRLRNLMGVK